MHTHINNGGPHKQPQRPNKIAGIDMAKERFKHIDKDIQYIHLQRPSNEPNNNHNDKHKNTQSPMKRK